MFTKKSSKALEKLINTPLIKVKQMILKTQKRNLASIDENFIGDDLSLPNEAFNKLEVLLQAIQIQFQFMTKSKNTIALQKMSIELFQKTKLISQYIINFTVNQKDFLVAIIDKIVADFESFMQQVNFQTWSVNEIYQNYILPSFIIIKSIINPNDDRILAKPENLNRSLPLPTANSQSPPASTRKKCAYKIYKSPKRSKFIETKLVNKPPDIYFGQFKPDKLQALIDRMRKTDPKSIRKDGYPKYNFTLFKEFRQNSDNYIQLLDSNITGNIKKRRLET